MNAWLDVQVKHEQARDLLRDVENRRRIAAARVGKPRIDILGWLSQWRSIARRRLQTQFGNGLTSAALNDMEGEGC